MNINKTSLKNITFVLLVLMMMSSCGEGTSESTKAVTAKTESGYVYTHHIKNSGEKAKVGDEVEYHQIVRKNDEILQSTHYFGKPVKIVLPPRDQVASPVHPTYEGLQLMAVGDSMTLMQLLDTVQQLPPSLKPTDTLSYDVVVVGIRSKEVVEKEMAAFKARGPKVAAEVTARIDDYLAGKLDSEIKTTESGLKYIIHKQGDGPQAVPGKSVSVHYTGFLKDKSNFDNSFDRGAPIDFPLGKGAVIKGWDEGIALLKKGGTATLFVPYDLAYGEAGSPPNIPAKSELIFYVELEDVN